MNLGHKHILYLLGGLLILFIAIANLPLRNPALESAHIRLPSGESISIEVARTGPEQILGLSGRESLPENHGMLFVYDQLTLPSFWMRDMHFPIDIIWLHDGEIVGVVERFAPESFPESVSPEVGVNAVLEVNAGFFEHQGLVIGDRLEIVLPE